MNIEFDVQGMDRAIQTVRGVEDRTTDARPAFTAMVDDFRQMQEIVFLTEGGAIGRPWKPLAPAYLRNKVSAGRGSHILQLLGPNPRTGHSGQRLMHSLMRGPNPWNVTRIGQDEMEAGTKLGIADVHQRGGTVTTPRAGTVTIPARPFVALTQADADRWSELLARWLGRGEAPTRVGL